MNKDVAILREVITKVTPMIAGRGVLVTQRGAQAYARHDPITHQVVQINIPHVPDNADREFILAIQGFIDHEVGHALETDGTVYKAILTAAADYVKSRKKPLEFVAKRLKGLWNVVEDPFVEKGMQRRFPGAAHNLDNLHRLFLARITEPALGKATTPEERFSIILVPAVRALAGQVIFQEWMDKGKHWGEPLIAALFGAMSKELRAIVANPKNTHEALEAARGMFEILVPPPPPPQPAPPQPKQEQEPSSDDESDEGDDEEDNEEKADDKKSSEGEQDEKSEDADGEGSNEELPEDEEDKGTGGESRDEKDESDADPADDGDSDAADEADGEGDEADGEADGGEADADDEAGTGEDAADDAEPDEDDGDAKGAAEGGADADEGEDGEGEKNGKAKGDADGAEDQDGNANGGEPEAEGDDEASGSAGSEADPEDGDAGSGEGGSSGDEESEGSGDAESGLDQAGGASGEMPDDDSAGYDDPAEGETQSGGGIGSNSPFVEVEVDLEGKSLADGIGKILTEDATDAAAEADYLTYTRDLDKIEPFEVGSGYTPGMLVSLEDKVRHMIAPMQKDLERMMAARSQVINVSGYRSGRLHGGSLHRLMVNDDRVFRRRQENKSKDTCVTLLIDNSGSMCNGNYGPSGIVKKMTVAMQAGFALSQTLERVGVANEVIGFTTMGLPRGLYDEIDTEAHRIGRRFSRCEPIYMPIYKAYHERLTPDVKKRFAYAIEATHFCNSNVDGECVEQAALRMMPRREVRKVLLVLSDGHPAASGSTHELNRHLKDTVKKVERAGIETIGIGIMDASVKTFYPKHMVLNDIEELPKIVMGELKRILTAN